LGGVPALAPKTPRITKADLDAARMRELVAFTFKAYETDKYNPFGSEVINTATGERLVRCINAVGPENDPSCHAEVRAIRLACKKIKTPSLKGYTLYTTCEPCPMCMSTALWAGVDRVVYGATIADAAKHCFQIYLSAREVAAKSDMPKCDVTGPIEQELAYSLFTHPKMLAAFRVWMKGKRRKLVT
jgi:tRNA(Arg) A34 adenosine deaminase TadA